MLELRQLVHQLRVRQDSAEAESEFAVVAHPAYTAASTGSATENRNNSNNTAAVDFRLGSERRAAIIR